MIYQLFKTLKASQMSYLLKGKTWRIRRIGLLGCGVQKIVHAKRTPCIKARLKTKTGKGPFKELKEVRHGWSREGIRVEAKKGQRASWCLMLYNRKTSSWASTLPTGTRRSHTTLRLVDQWTLLLYADDIQNIYVQSRTFVRVPDHLSNCMPCLTIWTQKSRTTP